MNNFENVNKMDKVLENKNLPKMIQKVENLSSVTVTK